jgi:hypothetical protein
VFKNCYIANSSSSGTGGAIMIDESGTFDMTFLDSQFYNCTASLNGGAIQLQYTKNIKFERVWKKIFFFLKKLII